MLEETIKIMGIQVNHDLNIDNHLNYITSKCYNVVHNIKKVTKYTDQGSRLRFINAHVLGKLGYMLPILSSANTRQMNKVHKLVMFSARTIIGDYCFKKSINYILGKIKWMTAKNMIIYQS